jgi:anti-sigma B factor antagonist
MAQDPVDPLYTPGELFRVSTSVSGDSVVVAAIGDIDAVTVPELSTAVLAAIGDIPGQRVVLDLSEVSFLGSHGLAMLVDIATRARQVGRPLRLVVDHQHPVIRPLEITGIDNSFALYHTLGEALAP